MMRHHPLALALLLAALPLSGCDTESSALIQVLQPLNSLTAQALSTEPLLRMREGVAIDAGSRRVVLYDVTKGAKKTVPGDLAVEGTILIYTPRAALVTKHDYLLEIKKEAVNGDDFELLDGSEEPEEALTWPLRFRFSTRTSPRVRAAYLDKLESGVQRVTVHFSQAMAPIPSGKAVQILDGVSRKPLSLSTPVWLNDRTMRVSSQVKLDGTLLYTLKVAGTAAGANGIALDGDQDDVPGEKKDDFCVGFSGIQQVIFSRLGTKKPSPCP